MNLLTVNEIDNVCLEILENIKTQYSAYYPHVYFMYWYGVRIGETFNNSIVYNDESDKIEISPQKKNLLRECPVYREETIQLLEKLHLSSELFWINKRNLQRILSKVSPYRRLMKGNKNIGAHIFRHNWVKKEIKFGHQYSTINSMLGYTNQTIAQSYAISKIYY